MALITVKTRRILDWLFPRRCLLCHRIPEEKTISFLETGICRDCTWQDWLDKKEEGEETLPDWIHVSFRYEGEIRQAVGKLKYEDAPWIGVMLGRWMAEEAGESVLRKEDRAKAILLPVPLAKEREKQRGYNQAKILAEAISEVSGIKTGDYLMRIRETLPQKDLGNDMRSKNVKGAFSLLKEIPEKDKEYFQKVYLIDDIVTTGATLLCCKEEIQREFPKAEVVGWALSREKFR